MNYPLNNMNACGQNKNDDTEGKVTKVIRQPSLKGLNHVIPSLIRDIFNDE